MPAGETGMGDLVEKSPLLDGPKPFTRPGRLMLTEEHQGAVGEVVDRWPVDPAGESIGLLPLDEKLPVFPVDVERPLASTLVLAGIGICSAGVLLGADRSTNEVTGTGSSWEKMCTF